MLYRLNIHLGKLITHGKWALPRRNEVHFIKKGSYVYKALSNRTTLRLSCRISFIGHRLNLNNCAELNRLAGLLRLLPSKKVRPASLSNYSHARCFEDWLSQKSVHALPKDSEESHTIFMTIKDGLSSSFVETIAGFTAGIVSTLCLHPLDLLKTRLQGT
jgi:hypothetical protein